MDRPDEESSPDAPCPPGELWARVREQSRRAIASGELAPLETRSRVLPEGGIPFTVQYASSLREKHARDRGGEARGGGDGAPESPFLRPEPALEVAGLSPTHRALLNRFPVIPHHLLVVTRDFEEQSLPLDLADLSALARCLDEIDGLGFFNSGPVAGASQRHRHLQVVPFPVGAGPEPTPIDGVLAAVLDDPAQGSVPAFPFRHAVLPLPPTLWRAPEPEERVRRAGEAMHLGYRALAARVGLALVPGEPAPPHNLLATRRWMLLVPRRREGVDGLSINALGYAGSILIRNKAEWQTVQRHGPLEILRRVAVE